MPTQKGHNKSPLIKGGMMYMQTVPISNGIPNWNQANGWYNVPEN